MTEEKSTYAKLRRRLAGERASVMLEFAFVAPLVAVVAIFAADFTRILRTEQQLEIAARLAADVEAHMADYGRGNGDDAKKSSPSAQAKNVCAAYLYDVANVVTGKRHVYVKGGVDRMNNPITVAVDAVASFFDGKTFKTDEEDVSVTKLFVNVLGKILGGIANLATFRTQKYLTEVIPHDREVWTSVAAYIPTVLPSSFYDFVGLPKRGSSKHAGYGDIGVGQFTVDLKAESSAATAWSYKIKADSRHRVYCYMPVMDSTPVAPVTYIRKFKSWCAKTPIMKGLVK